MQKQGQGMRDAREIANFFLDYADSVGVKLTNMSLLKILYYAHAWHLRDYGTPLVKNKFEAWKYGPVVRTIYDAFKDSGAEPITTRAKKFDAATNSYIIAEAILDNELQQFLTKKVFEFYGRLDAFSLSSMSHEKDAPWDRVYTAVQEKVHLQSEIPNELIKAHFRACAN